MRGLRHAAFDIRDDVDDVARRSVRPPALGRLLHHPPGAVEIGVDDGEPALAGEIDRVLRKLASGVVDQRIKSAEPVVDRRIQFIHRFGIAYVRGPRKNPRPSRLVYGGLRRIELFLTAAADCPASSQSNRKEVAGRARATSPAKTA